jgi:hypothetical protein
VPPSEQPTNDKDHKEIYTRRKGNPSARFGVSEGCRGRVPMQAIVSRGGVVASSRSSTGMLSRQAGCLVNTEALKRGANNHTTFKECSCEVGT